MRSFSYNKHLIGIGSLSPKLKPTLSKNQSPSILESKLYDKEASNQVIIFINLY